MTYKNKITKYHGSADMDLKDKNRVKDILKQLGFEEVKFNLFLIQSKNIEDQTYQFVHQMTDLEARHFKIIARPDVVAFKENRLFIIEIDGKVHKSNLDNRPIYEELELPYVIINKEYLNQENIDWKSHIKHFIENNLKQLYKN